MPSQALEAGDARNSHTIGALGLHHEHQSPATGCDKEYDWHKLYKYYKDAYDWDKPKVDQNVRQLIADVSAYDWSTPDPASVMVYASDLRFLPNGTASPCYFSANHALSALDKEGAQMAYPRQGRTPKMSTRLKALEDGLARETNPVLRQMLEQQIAELKKKRQQK